MMSRHSAGSTPSNSASFALCPAMSLRSCLEYPWKSMVDALPKVDSDAESSYREERGFCEIMMRDTEAPGLIPSDMRVSW